MTLLEDFELATSQTADSNTRAAAQGRVDAARAEVERLRAALREILRTRQWDGEDGDDSRYCTDCSAAEADGHVDDCPIAALLGEGEGPGGDSPPTKEPPR